MNAIEESPSTRHAGRGHIKALDGIRGLAILLVLFHHAFLSNFAAGGRLTQAVGELFHLGRMGVDLFFVLSGFLITGILLDTRADPSFFKKFYSRRVLRIFPLYYGVLLVLLALTPLLHFNWQGMRLLFLFDLQNLRPDVISNFLLTPSLGLFHFWSLAIEEQFYFVWPAVVFFIRDRRTLFKVTVTLIACSILLRLILVAAGVGEVAIRVDTLCRADALLLGGILAMLFRSRLRPRVLRLAPTICLATISLVAVSIVFLGDDGTVLPTVPHAAIIPYWISGLRYSVFALCFASLIAWSLRPASIMASVFQLRFLRFFGKYSYGIYVLHVPAITLLLSPIRTLLHGLTGSKGIAVAGSGILAILLSIAAAVLSFHLFEKPFLRLKRFFDYDPVKPPYRDFPLGTVEDPAFSDNIGLVVAEAVPQHSVTTR